ncbi:MAG: hypothetical protein H0U30_01995 [Actinobacteria bacterium]|nr:hypothetical protein [Actinomycetota bacterium]
MRWLTIVVALSAFLLVGAGCGGDDQAASDTATFTDTTTDETTTDDATTDDDLGDLASGECADLVESGQRLSQALGAGNLTDEDLDDVSRFFDEFADSAPEEIRADFQVLAEAWEVYAEVLPDLQVEPGETPDPEALANLQQATASIDQEEFAAASERINAWTTENC